MKRNKSLIFNIRLLSWVLSFFMLLFIASSFLVVYFNEKRDESKKAIEIYHTTEAQIDVARKLGYEVLENEEEIVALNKEGKNLLLDDDMIKTFASGNVLMLTYDQHYYFYFKKQKRYFKSRYTTSSVLVYFTLFIFVASLVVYLLLAYIRKSITPLKELHEKIEAFGKGDLNIDTRSSNHDEVAEVGNAFYEALCSIKQLEANRALFIRNISHELKTPLTKNTLMIHALKDLEDESKADLLANNTQVNRIIDTMSQFDSLQSRHLHLEKVMVNLLDVLEEAIEESEIPEEMIELKIENTSRRALDFERMVIAVKNLLRNAYLHSGKQKIYVVLEERELKIINENLGNEALDFNQITQAFYKESESRQGMGLGTYIAQSIVQLHGFSLLYEYESTLNRHCFMIRF